MFIRWLFQVFRLAALFLRGVPEEIPSFTVDLQGVAVPRRDVSTTILCVQHFSRQRAFTRRSFFSDTDVGMLQTAIEAAGDVCSNPSYDPWKSVALKSNSKVFAELTRSHNSVVGLRREQSCSRERWFGVESVASSVAADSPNKSRGVVFSDFVEVGEVSFLSQKQISDDLPGPSGAKSAPSKPKRAATPGKRRKEFEVPESPVVPKKMTVREDASFYKALERQATAGSTKRTSGRSRKVAQPYEPQFP